MSSHTCEIQDHQTASLAKVFGTDSNTPIDNSCEFVSESLNFPTGTILNKIISNGSFGIVANFITPSKNPMTVKIVLLNDDDSKKKLVYVNMSNDSSSIRTKRVAVSRSSMNTETFVQHDLYKLYKDHNIFGDLPVSIPKTIERNFVSTGKALFGVITMKKIDAIVKMPQNWIYIWGSSPR